MAYDYNSFVTTLATELVVTNPSTDVDFQTILPTLIDQAEQRIYREMDLLATIVADSSATTTPSQRAFTLPQTDGRFVVVKAMNLLNGNVRTPLNKISLDGMNTIWPSDNPISGLSVPVQYAPLTDQIWLIGPATSSPQTIEVIGTIRPAPLSVSNPTTYLSQYLPDLFLAAAMVAGTGYQRNFGSQSDQPQMAVSWEQDYQKRLASADKEEHQRKFSAFASTGA